MRKSVISVAINLFLENFIIPPVIIAIRPAKKTKMKYDNKNKSLPTAYLNKLKTGYRDLNNCLWEEFITTLADEVAVSFGRKLKNHQLRRFFNHVKEADNRLRMTNDWNCVKLDVKKLSPFVSEAKGKGKIPHSFYEFIDENVKQINARIDFEAFVEHFQAVVAYFTYRYPKN